MTFCLGMKVEEGLVAIADTRITTGSEQITAKKISVHQHGRHSLFIMTSGLRSARDKAVTYFDEVLEEESESFDKLYKAVNKFAEQIRRVASEDKDALDDAGLTFNLFAVVGGQLERDNEHKLYLLYPQGNWVEVTRGSPYYIIGESSYGKPMMDRVLHYECSLEVALKAGYLAFDATRTSATDVGFPLDVVLYRRDSYKLLEQRLTRDQLWPVSEWWQERIRDAVAEAPSEWATNLVSELPKRSVDG